MFHVLNSSTWPAATILDSAVPDSGNFCEFREDTHSIWFSSASLNASHRVVFNTCLWDIIELSQVVTVISSGSLPRTIIDKKKSQAIMTGWGNQPVTESEAEPEWTSVGHLCRRSEVKNPEGERSRCWSWCYGHWCLGSFQISLMLNDRQPALPHDRMGGLCFWCGILGPRQENHLTPETSLTRLSSREWLLTQTCVWGLSSTINELCDHGLLTSPEF